MKEKDFQRMFSRCNEINGVFELKLCKRPSLPFSAVEEHQVAALLAAAGPDGVSHKISDMSLDRKPFDCFRIAGYPAYVVVMFWKPRKEKVAWYITIGDFVRMRDSSSRKSMTEEMAKETAFYCKVVK